jgi:uncharacterized membrane protein YphA (DoxX/SURF4 family)
MSKFATKKVQTVLRWFIGMLFLWAAISKIANPVEFLASIYSYQMPMPTGMMKIMAITLPWIELLCALLLLANHWTISALLYNALLMVVFTIATGQAWIRGLKISCGCFDVSLLGLGPESEVVQQFFDSVSAAFFRDILLTIIVFWLFYLSARKNLTVSTSSNTAR